MYPLKGGHFYTKLIWAVRTESYIQCSGVEILVQLSSLQLPSTDYLIFIQQLGICNIYGNYKLACVYVRVFMLCPSGMAYTDLTIVKKRRISFGSIQGEQPGDQEQGNTQSKQSQHFTQGKGSAGKEGGAARRLVIGTWCALFGQCNQR